MAKPKFYLEPLRKNKPVVQLRAINMFYSFSGQRLQYYTGIRIEEKYFRPEYNESDNIKPIKTTARNAASYNQRLEDIRDTAINLISTTKGQARNAKYIKAQLDSIFKHKVKPTPLEEQHEIVHTFISHFEKFIEDRKTGKKLLTKGKNKGGRFSHNAIKNYSTSLSAIKRYMIFNGIDTLPIEAIDSEFYSEFSGYIYNIEKKEVSTFSNYIKDIKTVMEIVAPGKLDKDFIKPSYEADTIYCTVKQIEAIENFDLSDYSKSYSYEKFGKVLRVSYQTLDKVRNMALIGFYSGLRFSDFSTLDLKSIEGNFIQKKQTKTGSRVTIPIMSKLRPVLNKYPDALPTMSNQRFNENFKIIAKLAGLTADVTITERKGNIQTEHVYPFYSLVSSHICRRSYATNMFKAGVPTMLIMSATGHKTEAAFLSYIRASNEDKAKLLAETLQKLGL